MSLLTIQRLCTGEKTLHFYPSNCLSVNYEQTTTNNDVQYKSEKNEKLSVMKYNFETASEYK